MADRVSGHRSPRMKRWSDGSTGSLLHWTLCPDIVSIIMDAEASESKPVGRGEAPEDRRISTLGTGRALGLTQNLGGSPRDASPSSPSSAPNRRTDRHDPKGTDMANEAPTTLCEAFQGTAATDPDAVALRTSDGDLEITWAAYADRVRTIAGGLWSLGVRRGSTVGILLTNRPEFHLVDTAAYHLGATPFSIYPTLAPDQIDYVLANAEADVVVVEAAFAERIEAARASGGLPKVIVSVDGSGGDVRSLADLESMPADPTFDFESAWRAVEPADMLTLIYTSGTTGPPKGVELTHRNMLEQVRRVAEVLSIDAGDTITSYLPSAHIADRWSAHYNNAVLGVQVTSVADARTIGQVLPALRPTLWGAVPRVLEKLKAGLEAAISAEPDEERRTGLQRGIEVGIQVALARQAGEPISDELLAAHTTVEERVLAPLRQKLGLDRAKWIAVGAAPLARDVQEFLLGLGLPLTEMYGMSELSCVLSAASPAEARIGTVGRPIRGLEVRIADDGELLVQGDTVMAGYRHEPGKTAEAIDGEGWMHTGDVVSFDGDGHIRIVDRKKELIITSAGKNISPANIEGELKSASSLIGQAVAIGEGRHYITALLVLDPDLAAAHAARRGLAAATVASLARDPEVEGLIAEAVAKANERLARVEQVKQFALLADEWLPGGDELTPTMKLKRKAIDAKYTDTIESLYQKEER